MKKIERIDEIPLIFHWLMKMQVAERIDKVWRPHGNRSGLSYGQLAVLFITYVIHTLNHRCRYMEDWVAQRMTALEQITGWKINIKEATDDRLCFLLQTLGHDNSGLETYQQSSSAHLIQAFELPTKIMRYDTTSINVYHDPEKNNGELLDFGHSKNYRPDLLQFKQGIGTLDPAGVPIFSETLSGNQADDPQYIPAWRAMAKTAGRTDFLFVASIQASALETRALISKEKGFYLFPMPMTGKIPQELETQIFNLPVAIENIYREADNAEKKQLIGRGFAIEKEMTTGEGKEKHIWTERQLFVQSDAHATRQKKALKDRMNKAEKSLKKLKAKRDETIEPFRARASKVVEKYSVSSLYELEVTDSITFKKQYEGRGRPTAETHFKKVKIHNLSLEYSRLHEAVEKLEKLAGWRIYVTNTTNGQMTLQESIDYYRDEWIVERGMHRFKRGCLPVLPLFIRIPKRIKGLMRLLTIALQAITLIEFVIRRELAQQEEKIEGLVPGNPKMATATPTTERILAKFSEVNCFIEEKRGKVCGYVVEKLSLLQQQILRWLKIPIEIYEINFKYNVLQA